MTTESRDSPDERTADILTVNSTVGTDQPAPGMIIDALDRLSERTILDEQQLATLLKVSSRTIRRMVERYELPPPIPLGGRSVWLSGRILHYLDALAERAEQEALRASKREAEYR